MNYLRRQRGASFILWMLVLGIVGFSLLIAFRVAPIYIEYMSVKSVVDKLAVEMQGKDLNRKQLWEMMDRHLYINAVNRVKQDHFVYKQNKDTTDFGFKYEVRVPIIANVDAMITFEHMNAIKKP